MPTPEQNLEALGITLPTPAKPVANYVGWAKTGNLVFTAGQLPMDNGKPTQTGLLGADVSKDQGKAAARVAAINVIAQISEACGGNLSKVKRIVKLQAFVACTPTFTEHPFVVNGASDLMVEIFGDAGRHARTSIGCALIAHECLR
jgi:enamine deaminase RidA (YjgF/YER057c/UK114 family)